MSNKMFYALINLGTGKIMLQNIELSIYWWSSLSVTNFNILTKISTMQQSRWIPNFIDILTQGYQLSKNRLCSLARHYVF